MAGVALTRRRLLAAAGALLALGAPAPAQGPERVVSIGGAVTEIVHALDQQHRLVARDTTSTYPPAAEELPDVGYARALSPEGVLSVSPGLILATEGAGPPETLAVLRESGVPLVTVPEDPSGAGILRKIEVVGEALGVPREADRLAARTEAALEAADRKVARVTPEDRARVLFILSLQGGRILASGRDTQADAIIDMAGGVNAVTGFTGYKQITDEAVTRAAPDVILMMDRGGDHPTTDAVLFSTPAIRTTPAGQSGRVVRMPGLYLLGFGPRTAQAVRDLNAELYGETDGAEHDPDPS
jgi:iron complex transport system substrate-binding protein